MLFLRKPLPPLPLHCPRLVLLQLSRGVRANQHQDHPIPPVAGCRRKGSYEIQRALGDRHDEVMLNFDDERGNVVAGNYENDCINTGPAEALGDYLVGLQPILVYTKC